MKFSTDKIIVVLLSLAVFVFITLPSLDSDQPFRDYRFFLVTDPEVTIGEFHLFHNFSSQEGKIHFEYRSNQTPNRIEVEMPENIIYDYYEIRNLDGERIDNISTVINILSGGYNPVTSVVFQDFKKSVYYAEFDVYFKSNSSNPMYPNGRFFIFTSGGQTYGMNGYSGESDGTERAEFILGKYVCHQPCFYDMAASNVRPVNNRIIVDRKNEVGELPESGSGVSFMLNTFDGDLENIKSMIQDISTGIIVSLIFLLVEKVRKDDTNKKKN